MGWEDELLADTPRGIEGRASTVPAARWASIEEYGPDWRYTRQSVFLGYRNGQGVGVKDDRHVLVCAGSRAGKGVSFVMPNLLLYEGPVLCIDPKGELAKRTAKRRAAMGQKVVVIDPFDRSGDETKPYRGSLDPLAEIDRRSLTAVDDAALLADAMIVDDGSDAHWTSAARELVKGLILWALGQEAEEDRSLAFVRGFFHTVPGRDGKGEPVAGHLVALNRMMMDGDASPLPSGELVAGIAQAFLGKNERELTSIISTADVQLGFLDSAPLMAVLRSSSLRLRELKERKTTLYLCLPAARMATHAKWFRMVVAQTLLMAETGDVEPDPPLLLLLEEFGSALGYMRGIEAAAGQIASFGIKLVTILQDLTQLQRHYKASWETFLGNSGTLMFFGVSDATTLEYISKKCGVIGFHVPKALHPTLQQRQAGAALHDEQYQQTRLIEPHEVERLFARERERALVLTPGHSPLVVQRALYYSDQAFRGLF